MGNNDVAVIIDQTIDDLCADFLARGQVLQILAFKVDRHDVKVFIAAKVLHVQNAVAFPEISANIARRLAGHAFGFTAADGLHENIQAAFIRCQPRQIFAVGRYLVPSFLRVLEEIPHRHLLGGLRVGDWRKTDAAGYQPDRNGPGECALVEYFHHFFLL